VTGQPPAAAGRDHWFAVARFLFLGGCAAGVNWLSRFAWGTVAPFGVAVPLAYVTGMAVAFVLFRNFVFPKVATPMRTQVRNFVLVNVVGFSLTWALSMILVRWLFPAIGFEFYPEAVGHAVGIVAPTLSSWYGHKHFTFAEKL